MKKKKLILVAIGFASLIALNSCQQEDLEFEQAISSERVLSSAFEAAEVRTAGIPRAQKTF